MFKRIKTAWKLSKAPKEIKPEELQDFLDDKKLGDGKAEFLGDGTQEEFEEQKREDKGLKHIFGIGK